MHIAYNCVWIDLLVSPFSALRFVETVKLTNNIKRVIEKERDEKEDGFKFYLIFKQNRIRLLTVNKSI